MISIDFEAGLRGWKGPISSDFPLFSLVPYDQCPLNRQHFIGHASFLSLTFDKLINPISNAQQENLLLSDNVLGKYRNDGVGHNNPV